MIEERNDKEEKETVEVSVEARGSASAYPCLR
jgi:hypothetical protein